MHTLMTAEHMVSVHVPIEAQFGCRRCAGSFEFAHEEVAYLGHGYIRVTVKLHRLRFVLLRL